VWEVVRRKIDRTRVTGVALAATSVGPSKI